MNLDKFGMVKLPCGHVVKLFGCQYSGHLRLLESSRPGKRLPSGSLW